MSSRQPSCALTQVLTTVNFVLQLIALCSVGYVYFKHRRHPYIYGSFPKYSYSIIACFQYVVSVYIFQSVICDLPQTLGRILLGSMDATLFCGISLLLFRAYLLFNIESYQRIAHSNTSNHSNSVNSNTINGTLTDAHNKGVSIGAKLTPIVRNSSMSNRSFFNILKTKNDKKVLTQSAFLNRRFTDQPLIFCVIGVLSTTIFIVVIVGIAHFIRYIFYSFLFVCNLRLLWLVSKTHTASSHYPTLKQHDEIKSTPMTPTTTVVSTTMPTVERQQPSPQFLHASPSADNLVTLSNTDINHSAKHNHTYEVCSATQTDTLSGDIIESSNHRSSPTDFITSDAGADDIAEDGIEIVLSTNRANANSNSSSSTAEATIGVPIGNASSSTVTNCSHQSSIANMDKKLRPHRSHKTINHSNFINHSKSNERSLSKGSHPTATNSDSKSSVDHRYQRLVMECGLVFFLIAFGAVMASIFRAYHIFYSWHAVFLQIPVEIGSLMILALPLYEIHRDKDLAPSPNKRSVVKRVSSVRDKKRSELCPTDRLLHKLNNGSDLCDFLTSETKDEFELWASHLSQVHALENLLFLSHSLIFSLVSYRTYVEYWAANPVTQDIPTVVQLHTDHDRLFTMSLNYLTDIYSSFQAVIKSSTDPLLALRALSVSIIDTFIVTDSSWQTAVPHGVRQVLLDLFGNVTPAHEFSRTRTMSSMQRMSREWTHSSPLPLLPSLYPNVPRATLGLGPTDHILITRVLGGEISADELAELSPQQRFKCFEAYVTVFDFALIDVWETLQWAYEFEFKKWALTQLTELSIKIETARVSAKMSDKSRRSIPMRLTPRHRKPPKIDLTLAHQLTSDSHGFSSADSTTPNEHLDATTQTIIDLAMTQVSISRTGIIPSK